MDLLGRPGLLRVLDVKEDPFLKFYPLELLAWHLNMFSRVFYGCTSRDR